MALLKESINKVLSDDLNVNEVATQRPEFEEPILDVASTKSNIMTTEGLTGSEKSLLRLVLDEYLTNIQKLIWMERCNETIELEKQMGIFKYLERKKKGVKGSSDEGERDLDNIENIEKQKKE
ncbi:unnamed protein product [Rhizophagus irregularis]|nr:unnamed protein product [Rhizophagus irregularis]